MAAKGERSPFRGGERGTTRDRERQDGVSDTERHKKQPEGEIRDETEKEAQEKTERERATEAPPRI